MMVDICFIISYKLYHTVKAAVRLSGRMGDRVVEMGGKSKHWQSKI